MDKYLKITFVLFTNVKYKRKNYKHLFFKIFICNFLVFLGEYILLLLLHFDRISIEFHIFVHYGKSFQDQILCGK